MSRSPSVVRRLARFNVVATVVITLVITGLVGIGAAIAYVTVQVIGEQNVERRLQALRGSLQGLEGRIQAGEDRLIAALAKGDRGATAPFDTLYRPAKPSLTLSPSLRAQLDTRLQRPLPPGYDHAVTTWIEHTPARYERWQTYRDDQGRRLAARVAYGTPEARQAIDRRLDLLGDLHGVRLTWFPRLANATPALNETLRDHGLLGSWDALTLSGEVRGSDSAALPVKGKLTVNETQLRGEAIALAHPVAQDGLLIVALTNRTALAGILHYNRYLFAGTVAVLLLVWGAAAAWIRGTLRQAALAQQQANFVAAVSHELRTPLTAIRGAAEMLVHDMVPEAKKDGYYRSILGESDRLRRMVEQILDFDRLQRGQFQVSLQPTDLGALVEGVVGMMQPVAGKRDVVLEAHFQPGMRVSADPDTTAQALTNLIDNAVKFSPQGGEVRVLLESRDGRAVLAVEDAGPGVPAAERRRIFEAFYRVGDELTRQTKGSGLGLYLVKQYVEAGGGKIEVGDASIGGARFQMEWPLV